MNKGPGGKEWLCIGWLIGEMGMMIFDYSLTSFVLVLAD